MKQNASIDASFWINSCAANIIQYLPDYFRLYATSIVAREIRYPLEQHKIQAYSTITFNRFVDVDYIVIQDPSESIHWYQQGENSAISLAIEEGFLLLIDDAKPYHRAKAKGLRILGTMEIIAQLFIQEQITYQIGIDAIKRTGTSKPQKRDGLAILEMLERRKRNPL